jgi:secondary thiamine-phosphate synthase enzyme
MVAFYEKLAQGDWAHNKIDNNAQAHLSAIAIGNSVMVPVTEGEPALGTWQSILFVELDGPRERQVYLKELGK